MKYLWIGLSVLTLFFGGLYMLLFTQWGNSFMKPYVQDMIEKKIQKQAKIEAFTLKTGFIDMEVLLEGGIKAIINGDFDLWRKTFDIDYILDAKNLETPYVNINTPLNVEGKLKGNIVDFTLDGSGRAFRSDISFATQINKNEIKNIKIDANSLKIEDVLSFLKKPIYTKGIFDLHVDAKRIDKNSYKGDADILIHHGSLVADVVKEEFGLKLIHSVTYKGAIDAVIDGMNINAQSDIKSNIANIQSENTQYDLEKKVFYSDYKLLLQDLKAIGAMFDIPMQGSVSFEGNLKHEGEDLALDANSDFLDGELKTVLLNDTINIQGKDLDVAKLAWTFKQPRYSNGKFDLKADLSEINSKKPIGDIAIVTKNANLNGEELRDMVSKDFPTSLPYDFSFDAKAKKDGIFFDSDFKSKIANLLVRDSKADMDTKQIQGDYTLHVSDLNNLYFLTKKPMRGEMKASGDYVIRDGNISITGVSDVLDAVTTFSLKDNTLHVSSEELSIINLSEALFYPKVFDAFATLKMDYDLNSKQGAFALNAMNGKMLENELTRLLLLVSKFDMTQEVFKESTLKGMIQQDDVDFSMAMNGIESYFKIPKGYINLKNKKIDSDFSVKIEHRDFDGSITGSLDEPKVELDSSEYLKQKIDKAIDKNVPEDFKEPVKELLKLFG